MSIHYRQCRLTRSRGRAVEQYTTWLPEPFAVAGAVVRLRDDDGDWGEGWDVAAVGPFTLSEDAMRKSERAYRKQRRASDLPRGGRTALAD
jgi:hypothetical protein